MASLVLSGDTSGSITVAAPAIAGSNTQTLVAATGTLAPLISGTAVASTSGTSIQYTSIPSWVKRITVMLNGVSGSSTGVILVQLGTSSGYETSGYSGVTFGIGPGGSVAPSALSSGFSICDSAVSVAAATWRGNMVITLLDSSTNSWTCTGGFARGDSATSGFVNGSKSLSATLDRLRLYIDGTQTFDAGTINILYE